MLTLTARARRNRLVRRHHLDGTATTPLDAVISVLALHATDPATVYLSVLCRCPTASIDDVSRALYDDGSLVRMIAMRRTLFVLPTELAPVVHAAASATVAERLHTGLVRDLTTLPTDPPLTGDISAWLDDVGESVENILRRRGSATANELSADEPRLRTALLPVSGKKYDVRRTITSRVLTLLGTQGRIVRGRPRGMWTSRAHVWEAPELRWPRGMPDVPVDEARRQLARRWLAVFGPAPAADLAWWTGWTAAQTHKALAAIDVVEVELDDVPGIGLADDLDEALEDAPAGEPMAALLPALDPTPMGWQRRDWFLGPHAPRLFDRSGNVGPTVWWDGRVVGGWAVRAGGQIAWQMLEDVGADAEAAVAAAAQRLQHRLGGTVVVPSFRTPLERELSN